MTAHSHSHPHLRRSIYPAAFGRSLGLVARIRTRRWDRAALHVEREQEKVLAAIVEHARGTDFGKAHDFGGVRSYADFQARVPVSDYDRFSPMIERMRKGERNVLVPERVTFFGNSSGSSRQGKPKFLPITETQIAHQRRSGADTLMRWLDWSGERDFLTGYTIGLFPPTTMKEDGASLVTSNPALMVTQMPLLTRPVYLPHDDIKTMPAYDAKIAAIAERYLDWDVRAVAGTTCWFTILFERVLDAARRRGRKADTVGEIWPNLRVLLGGGVAAAPYRPVIDALVGRDVTLVDTYNATEGGIYAATDFHPGRGMLMLPHRGTFFEFVPQGGSGTSGRVPLWKVEPDRPYSIVVTTTSGLYAYEVGDIVRFTSVRPHRIEFMGRLAGCLSLTQELTTHVEIERAVEHANQACGCRTLEFGAAADDVGTATGRGRYVLFVEFADGAAPPDVGAYAAAFDEGLARENRVYREHRAGDVAILPARVEPLTRGSAQSFLAEVTNGNVQGKFPRILDESKRATLARHVERTKEVRSPS